MSRYTLVETLKIRGQCNHRLRFGQPIDQIILGENKRLEVFRAGQVFGYIRWSRNGFGTRNWQLFVVRSVGNGRVTQVPGVYPGGELLFRTRGVLATQKALIWLDKLEQTIPFLLSDLPDSYWRLAENNVFTAHKLPGPSPHFLGNSHA